MNHRKWNLFRSELLKNASYLGGGTILGQLFQLIAVPVIGHLYAPAAFGEWTLIQSVAVLAAAVGGLRYDLAVALPASDDDATTVVAVQTLFNLATSSLALLGAVLFHHEIATMLGLTASEQWIVFVPLLVLFSGVGLPVTYWLIRKTAFAALAQFRFLQSVGTSVFQIASFSLMGRGVGGLVIGGVLGQAVPIAASFPALRRTLRLQAIRQSLQWRRLLASAIQYRHFPQFMVPLAITSSCRDRGVFILLSSLADTRTVGLYALAMRVVYAPFMLITTSLNPILYQRAASASRPSEVGPLLRMLLSCVVLAVTPTFVVFGWLAPRLFGVALGNEWRKAGVYAAILTGPAFTLLLSGLMERMLDVVNQQRTAFALELGYTISALGAVWLGLAVLHSTVLSLSLFAFTTVTYHLARMLAVYRLCHLPITDLASVATTTASLAVCSLAFIYVLSRLLSAWHAALVAAAGVLCYTICVLVLLARRHQLLHTRGLGQSTCVVE